MALLLLVGVLAWATAAAAGAPPPRAVVVAPRDIPLTGPAADPEAEISSMAWVGDTLLIVPEVPTRFARGDTLGLFTLDGGAIRAWLDGDGRGALEPRRLDCLAPGLVAAVPGFDGLEAVTFRGRRCYLTVEAKQDAGMACYLVGGTVDLPGNLVRLDPNGLVPIPLDASIFNRSVETLVIDGRRIVAIAEVNGGIACPEPRARVFDENLEPIGTLPMPRIEYRLTDATGLDAEGRFWVINYNFPPDGILLPPAPDPELARHGAPAWLAPDSCVERLLELRITADGRIVRTDTPPIWLLPRADGECRNWEAIVRLDDRGFLLMTDKYPTTLLAFVPRPNLD